MDTDTLYQTYEHMDEALAPSSEPYDSAHDMVLAQKYIATGLFEDALAILVEIVRHEQTNAEAHYLKGLILLEQKQPVAAIYAISEACRWHPAEAKYRIAAAQAFLNLNDFPKAKAEVVEALMLEHNEGHASFLKKIISGSSEITAEADAWVTDMVRANTAFDARDNETSTRLYQTLLTGEPSDAPIKERLLNLERQRKHPGQVCPKAWDNVRLRPDGHVEVCCLARFPVGDLKNSSLEDVWNGEKVKKFRQSVLDDSYRYCPHDTCHILRSGQFSTAAESTSVNITNAVTTGDLEIIEPEIAMSLVYDQTCNLSCPSCRTERIVLKGDEFDKAKMMHDLIKEQCLKGLARIHISGQGDPFASRLYRDLLYTLDAKDYPNLVVHLHTNGLLLNAKSWSRMEKIKDRVEIIGISIDAATEETYRKLRRGGELKHLLPNLEFAKKLRQSGAVKYLRFSFVVQESNYHEMPAFVEMSKTYGADAVKFQRRRGHSGAEIFDVVHQDFDSFLDVLENPIMSDDIVQIFWADESLEAGGRRPRFNIGPGARKLVDDDEDEIDNAA